MISINNLTNFLYGGILILGLGIIILKTRNNLKEIKNPKKSKVFGELIKDLGLAFLVGAGFQYNIFEINYYFIGGFGIALLYLGIKTLADIGD